MRQARPDRQHPSGRYGLALLIVYIVWGSTYLAIRVVVGTMPPLLSAGVRFVIAAAILFGYVALRHGISSLKLSRKRVARRRYSSAWRCCLAATAWSCSVSVTFRVA